MVAQDLLLTAWESLWAHRLRTFLSILGIIIGIASFSLMYSIGESARQKTVRELKNLGGDVFRVSPPQQSNENNPSRGGLSFTLEDSATILKTCPAILEVSPELHTSVDYYKAGVVSQYDVLAVMPSYFKINNIKAIRGRLFSEIDTDHNLMFALLGQEKASELFPGKDPLNQEIAVNGFVFKVIGILEEHERLTEIKDNLVLPLPMALQLFPDREIAVLNLRGRDTASAMAEIKQFLFRRFGDKQFDVQSQRLLIKAQQTILRIVEYILWTIGSISLVVGGIGIVNIMLVSVAERVREIGIRRAIGAKKIDIKLQFFCEAVLLCILGGMGGALLGFAGSKLISLLFGFPTIFSVKLLFVSIITASILGVICGTYPAARAANQDPTIVLRYE